MVSDNFQLSGLSIVGLKTVVLKPAIDNNFKYYLITKILDAKKEPDRLH